LKIVTKDKNIRNEVGKMLKTLFPDGDVQIDRNGTVTLGRKKVVAKKSTKPLGAECISDLVNSKNDWLIIPDVADPTIPNGFLWPQTVARNFDGFAIDGKKGKGCGGEIHVPTSRCKFEFGAYDPTGKPRLASILIVFAHELCGHAWYNDTGEHDPRPQPRGNRPGHDQAIKRENKIRIEQSGKKKLAKSDMRGLFNDKEKGESVWRKKGKTKWETRRPTTDDLK
jgi:hypothetical protein